jgi:hypothetical protein
MLRHTVYLGCWTSLLTHEGAERWKRSFPGPANMCTDPVLGDGQGGHVAGVPTAFGDLGTTGDLLAELRMASPSCRRELPCPHGAPPVIGAQTHAAHGREPREGGNDNEGHNPPSTSMVSKLIAAWHTDSPITSRTWGVRTARGEPRPGSTSSRHTHSSTPRNSSSSRC